MCRGYLDYNCAKNRGENDKNNEKYASNICINENKVVTLQRNIEYMGENNVNTMDECEKDRSFLSRRRFREGALWIFFIVGFVLYIVYYTIQYFWPNICIEGTWVFNHRNAIQLILSIIQKIADILVIGAALGYVSNAAHFLKLFKDDLESIILDHKFLEKRVDINEIWDQVTAVLFRSRFHKISKNLTELIRDNYFPQNKSIYYDNYTSNVEICWVGNPKDEILNVKVENNYTMVSENKGNIQIPWTSWTKNSEEYKVISHEVYIDGEKQEIKEENFEEDEEKVFRAQIPLKGKETYVVRSIFTKQYSFKNDFYRAHSFSYIVNGFVVAINHPADLDLEFIERGTCKTFDIMTKTSTVLVAKYNGLILPHQGYAIAFKHNFNK